MTPVQGIKFDPVVKFFISVIGFIIIAVVLKELQHIFIPFVLAYFIYFIFNPMNNWLEKKKVPQAFIIILNLIIIMVFLFLISRIFYESFSQFTDQLPEYEQKLDNVVQNTASQWGINEPGLKDFKIRELLKQADYGPIAGNFFSSTLSVFTTIFFVLFFYLFIGSGHKHLYNTILNRYSDKPDSGGGDEYNSKYKVEETFRDIILQVQKYITTKFIIAVIGAAAAGIVLLLFDVDFLFVWVVLTFLLNFIPNIGSVVSVLGPTLVVMLQYESFGYGLLFMVILVVIQNLNGNVLEPKLYGDRMGLNPLVVLIMILVWGYIWGIVGMFLSVPLTATIKIILEGSNSPGAHFIAKLMNSK